MAATKITNQIADDVLDRMARGEILTAICREYDLTPGAFTHRAEKDAHFAQRYARARQEQVHAMAMDVVRIADEEPDPAKARVMCDARKWVAARIDPKNYGDRLVNEHTGADGGPIEVAVTPAQRRIRAATIIDAAFEEIPKPEGSLPKSGGK